MTVTRGIDVATPQNGSVSFHGVTLDNSPFNPHIVERSRTAIFTVFCGKSDNERYFVFDVRNYNSDIPFFFISDFSTALDQADKYGWKTIPYLPLDPEISSEESNRKCKLPRTLPTLFGDLDHFRYLVRVDSKRVNVLVDQLDGGDNAIRDMQFSDPPLAILMNINFLALRRRKNSWNIEDEFSEAMKQPRYQKDSKNYRAYINRNKDYGFTGNTVIAGGFQVSDNNHPMTLIIGKEWYTQISKSGGIEDQISLAFLYERYAKYIGVLRGIEGRSAGELLGM